MTQYLAKLIARILPNCLFKDIVRFMYYQARGKLNFEGYKASFDFLQWSFCLAFTEGPLEGKKIYFPPGYSVYNNQHYTPFYPRSVQEFAIEANSYFQRQMIEEGDLVIDAGAYPGDITVLLSNIVGPTGKVIALEPNEKNRSYLERLLQKNQVKNVTILPYALSDKTGIAYFHSDGVASSFSETESETVEAITLDDLLLITGYFDEHGKSAYPTPKLKMDIEGAETVIIPYILEKAIPVDIIVAVYHLDKMGHASHEMLTPLLETHGYSVEMPQQQHLVLYARPPINNYIKYTND